jgi:hypothetical protein
MIFLGILWEKRQEPVLKMTQKRKEKTRGRATPRIWRPFRRCQISSRFLFADGRECSNIGMNKPNRVLIKSVPFRSGPCAFQLQKWKTSSVVPKLPKRLDILVSTRTWPLIGREEPQGWSDNQLRRCVELGYCNP